MTVNVGVDTCNCYDDSRGDRRSDRRWSRRYSRKPSWAAATIAATDDWGFDTVVVYSVEIRIFATSNGRRYSRSDSRVTCVGLGDPCRHLNIHECEIRSVTLVARFRLALRLLKSLPPKNGIAVGILPLGGTEPNIQLG